MFDATMKAMTVGLVFILGMVSFPVLWVLFTGDFPGAAIFYGLQEDNEFVNMVFTIREFFA